MSREPVKPRSIKVSDSEWDAAMATADNRGDVLSEVIRAALRRYVKRYGTSEPPLGDRDSRAVAS